LSQENKGKNFLVSPLSAFIALSAAMTGARGKTQLELGALLMGPKCAQSDAFLEWIKLMSQTVQVKMINFQIFAVFMKIYNARHKFQRKL